MDMQELLVELAETPGVSGDEQRVRDVVRTRVEAHADEVVEDDLGNLIVSKGSGETTLMLIAHMDQIGLSVQSITDDGFVKFSKVGGVTLQSLMNQRVVIHTGEGPVTGVVGMKPPHLMKKEERDALPEQETLFLDIGAEDAEDAEAAGVRVGDYITFDRDVAELLNGYVTGAGFDNRAGVAATIAALERFDADYELVCVFSVQEEVGLKGAKTAAFRVEPDVALAVDTSIAGDVPGIEPHESGLETGKGVEITMIQAEGRGLITPERVKRWLLETAENEGHAYQPGVWSGGATDAANVYLVKEGIPTGSIGIPTRHVHSATEVVTVSDLEQVVDYLESVFGTVTDYF